MKQYKVRASYFGASITFYLQAANDAEALRIAEQQARETFSAARGMTKDFPLLSWTDRKLEVTPVLSNS